jgi:hypothetical protein
MFRIAYCALALFGFSDLAWAQSKSQESGPKFGQEPSMAPRFQYHIPSSGLTLEKLNGLPPIRNDHSTYQGWVYQPYTQQAPSLSSMSQYHIPSSGLTLEKLNGLPPIRNESYSNQGGVYQPYTSVGSYPNYSLGYQYNSYGHSYGLGGYYPPGAGGYYPSAFGWWF